jgi:3-phytase
MSIRALLLLLTAALTACSRPASEAADGPAAVTVAAAAETAPTAEDGANGVAIWIHADDPTKSLILGAGGTGGLEVYGLDGALRQRIGEIESTHVAVRDGFTIGGQPMPLVLVYESLSSSLLGYTIDATQSLVRLPGAAIVADDELTGLCTFRSPITGSLFALGMTDGGQMLQWELLASGDALEGRLVRSVALGKGIEYCVVDDASGTMYYGDEALGVLSVPVEPETDPSRSIVEMIAPRGGIAEEIKGLALVQGADGAGLLLVSDVSAERVAAYALDGSLKGRLQIGAAQGIDAVGESEGLALAAVPAGPAYPEGFLAIADQDNDGAYSNFKLVGWREARTALGISAGAAPDPRADAATAHTVVPTLETPAVETWGDAADDAVIWAHPTDAAKSVVIATDKNLGLYVYDLDGRLLQTVPDGRMNNVDLRDGFLVDGKPRTLVAASNRTDKSIALYWLDPATRRLASAGDAVPTGLGDPYGLCMYADASGTYAFVNNGDDGLYRQWRITAAGGKAVAAPVRDFAVGSQAEGCVADDETGSLYVAEEDGGFFKYSAKPDGGAARREIDRVDSPNGLKADIEGVSIWRGKDGRGFLVLSNQGADSYAVYRREGDNAFVGIFHVVADAARGIDGVSETDGLDVSSAPLGPRYPDGLMVAQDGRNLSPRERQNYKFVSWRAIAESLGIRE